MGLDTKKLASHLPPEVAADIAAFTRESQRLLAGEIDPDTFTSFRTLHGVYGQRQEGFYMVRVKIPLGRLNAAQVERLADVAETFARGVGHVTTRQDVELHWVRLEEVPLVMQRLAEVGLTSREACGNTVRNVTACPLAGICPDEVFDVTPFALAVSQVFLRHPLVQRLPRKFKMAFSGCPADCAYAPIHDIGAVATVRRENGVVEKGFRLFVGGGLGPAPRQADVLEDFLPAVHLLPTCKAVLRVFDRLGERRNRNLARLKFLVKKLGLEEFRRLVYEEREQLEERMRESVPPEVAGGASTEAWRGSTSHLSEQRVPAGWVSTNVIPQRQRGYFAVHIRLTAGDISAGQLRTVAKVAREFGNAEVRTTNQQNLLLPWIAESALPSVYQVLEASGLASGGAGRLVDITACPGAETCRVGITNSKALTKVLENTIEREGLADLEGVRIKVSGCPNSCGHHYIATIGLYGGAHRVGEHHLPCYHLLLGGGGQEDGVRFGRFIARIPAKRVPEAVIALVRLYQQEHQRGGNPMPEETFIEFIGRLGRDKLKEVLGPFIEAASFEESPEDYYDWGAGRKFALDERSEGECAR
ncbi:MAG: nitrite/sulfite reductase [Armatimonadota bacterium]|nr:nitrite/sulfite reductase [Armatimonadota bacterium]MDR5702240.1 nitrite/sulfite reductase [Armatimonadota bacterium]